MPMAAGTARHECRFRLASQRHARYPLGSPTPAVAPATGLDGTCPMGSSRPMTSISAVWSSSSAAIGPSGNSGIRLGALCSSSVHGRRARGHPTRQLRAR